MHGVEVISYDYVLSVWVWSLSRVGYEWQCLQVWQVVYIWGTDANDTGNDVWVMGRSHGFLSQARDTGGRPGNEFMQLYCQWWNIIKRKPRPKTQAAWNLFVKVSKEQDLLTVMTEISHNQDILVGKDWNNLTKRRERPSRQRASF